MTSVGALGIGFISFFWHISSIAGMSTLISLIALIFATPKIYEDLNKDGSGE
jgi:hypothetical protein